MADPTPTPAGTEAPVSVMREAAVQLGAATSISRFGDLRRREFGRPGNRLALGAVLIGLVAIAALTLGIDALNLDFLPSRRPVDPAADLATLWQVQAAMVAIGFPLLVLFIEFARSKAVLAKSSGEILTHATFIVPGLVFAAGGVVTIGFGSAWLPTDTCLVMMFTLIFIPSVVALLWAYWTALRLFFDQRDLQRRSLSLLKDRLRRSIDHAWTTGLANYLLLESLRTTGAERAILGIDELADDPDWLVVRTGRGGLITDVNARKLREVLDQVAASRLPPQDSRLTPPSRLPLRMLSPQPASFACAGIASRQGRHSLPSAPSAWPMP